MICFILHDDHRVSRLSSCDHQQACPQGPPGGSPQGILPGDEDKDNTKHKSRLRAGTNPFGRPPSVIQGGGSPRGSPPWVSANLQPSPDPGGVSGGGSLGKFTFFKTAEAMVDRSGLKDVVEGNRSRPNRLAKIKDISISCCQHDDHLVKPHKSSC
jgi:hypothetical protein